MAMASLRSLHVSFLLLWAAVAVATAPESGPAVAATPGSGPAVVAASESGPAVAASPESGPAVAAAPESGPAVTAASESGPAVAAVTESGPEVAADSESGPAVAAAPERAHVAKLTDFGGVSDGTTSNTEAFAAAVANLSKAAAEGGAKLVVPAGRWLTGPFNLTSHFTLFLEKDAVILASQNMEDFPIIAPLPSYGRGRDLPGGRYSNFIMGYNLTDVVITGNNGTIDGQGQPWWEKFRADELKYTRGYLLEFMNCQNVVVSDITLKDSPSWNLHPVYSSDVTISGVTIVAPLDSPNTDGIDPDSCTNVKILNSYVACGDDCIAIKSGWDQYGITYNMPSKRIHIKDFTCVSPTSATIALGSEMSGGIEDVRAEGITAIDTESGVRIKTAVGRGGYVKDIFVRGMSLHNMKYVFWMTGSYGQHPDDKFDPNAIPKVQNINYGDITATNVTIVGKLEGIENSPYTGICLSNVTAELFHQTKKPIWNCTFVEGASTAVTPAPCAELKDMGPKASPCKFLEST